MAVKERTLDLIPPMMQPGFTPRVPCRELYQLPKGWFHIATGPAFGRIPIRENDNDLTKHGDGPPHGQRITLSGRILDSDGRGVPNALIEIWQANSSGRYMDKYGGRPGLPLDPNFIGAGRCMTDSDGNYHFTTIRPAAYAGREGTLIPYRASHVHFSIFGHGLTNRVGTTCYFQGDPLFPDFVAAQITDPKGRERLLAHYDEERTVIAGPASSIGFRWDVVLRGETQTPFEFGT